MSRRLRVVLVHRYFVPDTPPYAHMLRSIAGSLAAQGHEVHVLTCQPSYRRDLVGRAPARETIDGVGITRFPVLDDRSSSVKKLLNLVWFAARLALSRKAFRDADVVMAGTTPPIAIAALCSWLARRGGARFVYHKQDVWPEVSGRNGPLTRLLRRLDHATETRSAAVVVLSSDMAATVRARGAGVPRIEVLNNFDPWTLEESRDRASGRQEEDPAALTIVFAGNLGRFQGLEHLVQVVELTAADEGVAWHFFGEGPMRPLLEGLGPSVRMHGHQPPEVVAEFVAQRADLGVVSLNKGVIQCAYPSKTMTYLRNGCPVLALVEADSELATMIEDERIGIAGSQDDPAALAARLARVAAGHESLDGAGERCRQVYAERFEVDTLLPRWVHLMESVSA